MKTVNNCNTLYKNEDFFSNFDRNYYDILKQNKDGENDCNQSDINRNSSSQGLSVSDDEALEDYLSALAKNYDDIDRRIKNAERFVNQIDENQNIDGILKNGFRNTSKHVNSKEIYDEKEVKYVTELRVNIADSLKNKTNFSSNYIKQNNDKAFIIRSPSELIKKKESPLIKKRVALSNNSTVKEKDKLINYDLCSINVNSDLEQVIIPPPKLFCSKYIDDDILKVRIHHKEVQTIDLNKNLYNIFSQSLLEDRGIQTVSPINYSRKKTIDAAVETDRNVLKKISKEITLKKEDNQSFTSHSSDIFETDKSNLSIESIKNEYSNNIINETDVNDKSSKQKRDISTRHYSMELSKNPHRSRVSDLQASKIATDIKQETSKPKKNVNEQIDKKHTIKSSKRIEKENIIGNHSIKINHTNQNSIDSAKNASLEIQRLLENLDSHLQARMNTKEINKYGIKHRSLTESNIDSFWDNPLQKNDIVSVKNKSMKSSTLKSNQITKKKVKNGKNIINSELQAICKTIEKNIKSDTHAALIQESSESENGFTEYAKSKMDPIMSESLNTRQNMVNAASLHNVNLMKKSTSNLNLAVETKFPCNYKMFRSFDLNPYDDIIKAHLSPIDRRVKSVAAKNDCTIIIDGPLKCYDPSNTQALRNKVMYRCTIAGSCKDSLDKCFNYLKETFPNTFLKTNSRLG